VSSTSSANESSAPAYPTSSRQGVKNWDKVASDLTSKKKKDKGKATEGDERSAESDVESIDSDYGSGDPVDGFFKKLYANADEDTRRAMMKSYYESQGTALSTNWDEVGKETVAVHPPSD
jgi:suppressor of G2 allele of SKP1